MGKRILCTICEAHYYEDKGLYPYDEFGQCNETWESNPVLQLSFYKDDGFKIEGEYYHIPHIVSYFLVKNNRLDLDKDLIERIKALNPHIIKNKSFLDLPETLLLEDPPETAKEAVELAERHKVSS